MNYKNKFNNKIVINANDVKISIVGLNNCCIM